MPEHSSDPSVTQQVMFDAICIQFEQDWRRGEVPSIESHLEQTSAADRPLLLMQLLLLELEYRDSVAEELDLDDYLRRFPREHEVVRRAFAEHSAAQQADDRPHRTEPGTIEHSPITEQAGSQIGRYKLLEQIGEGGMGVVYMAEQERPVRRKVALKIIKPGLDTKQVVARFEAERQALAMMDHPNIARVLDAGSTESGRPYFVMELVRGVSITDYCDQARLETRERLVLFKQVCQAVQHAHTKGIIHRDLKPTNVLVTMHDGVPVPKIIDFGVSKAMGQQLTEKTLFTAFAQMVGTPLYMSPEQAEMSGLDVDTRSDIYSLGVLLYELLTGVTPFDRRRLQTAAFDELRRIIREEEPEKPSTKVSSLGETIATVSAQRSTDPGKLKQLLRGELDWIVMKSLEKDRNRRYETANALVAEVDRYLNAEPVLACPPSTTYRVRKFVRRYRSEVAVAGGFLVLLLASSVIAWALLLDARRARNDALAAKADVTIERDRAILAEEAVTIERDRVARERDRADEHAIELEGRLYDYNFSRALAAFRDDDAFGAREFLDDCQEQHRHWEWHYLRRAVGIAGGHKLEAEAYALAVHPTQPLALVGNVAGEIQLINLVDDEVLWKLPSGNQFVLDVSFSPDGKRFAVVHVSHNLLVRTLSEVDKLPLNGGLQLRETATGAVIWEKIRSKGAFGGVTFNPIGHELVEFSGSRVSDLAIRFRDVETGTERWSVPVRGLPLSMVFSPDGRYLYSSHWSTNLWIDPSIVECVSTADRKTLWTVNRKISTELEITSDGSQLLLGGPGDSFQVWDPSTGKMLEQFAHGNQSVPDFISGQIVLSPGDKHLVLRTFSTLSVWDWKTKQHQRLLRYSASGMQPKLFFGEPVAREETHSITTDREALDLC